MLQIVVSYPIGEEPRSTTRVDIALNHSTDSYTVMCVNAHQTVVPAEARHSSQIFCSWNYRQLWAVRCEYLWSLSRTLQDQQGLLNNRKCYSLIFSNVSCQGPCKRTTNGFRTHGMQSIGYHSHMGEPRLSHGPEDYVSWGLPAITEFCSHIPHNLRIVWKF